MLVRGIKVARSLLQFEAMTVAFLSVLEEVLVDE